MMVLSLLCLGSWASAFKFAGKWRFELFYLDYAVGLMLAAVILAFTLGNSGYDGFNLMDDLQHAGKHQWFWVFLSGLIFNMGNMVLMAAVSVSGLAVAFPMGMGVALLVGSVLGISSEPAVNSLLLGLGCLLMVTSIVLNAASYRMMAVAQHEELARTGRAKSTRRPSAVKGIILAVLGGLLMGAFVPLTESARQGEVGLGPYALGFIFAIAVLFSSFVYDIFFINLPIAGEPLEFDSYLKGNLRQHLLGVGSGFVFYLGMLAAWVCTSVPAAIQGDSTARFLLLHGWPVLTALWGIVVFKEYKGNDVRVKLLGTLMLVLFLCGLLMVGLAGQAVRKG